MRRSTVLAAVLVATAVAAVKGDVANLLDEFSFVVQQTDLSCWAASAAMLMNYQYLKEGLPPIQNSALAMGELDYYARAHGLPTTPGLQAQVRLDVGDKFGDLAVLKHLYNEILKLTIETDVRNKPISWWETTLRTSGPILVPIWVPDFGHILVAVGVQGSKVVLFDPNGSADKPVLLSPAEIGAFHTVLSSKISGELGRLIRAGYWSPNSPVLPWHNDGLAILLFSAAAFSSLKTNRCYCTGTIVNVPNSAESVDPLGLHAYNAPNDKDRFFLHYLQEVPGTISVSCTCGSAAPLTASVAIPLEARLTKDDRSKWKDVQVVFGAPLNSLTCSIGYAAYSEGVWAKPASTAGGPTTANDPSANTQAVVAASTAAPAATDPATAAPATTDPAAAAPATAVADAGQAATPPPAAAFAPRVAHGALQPPRAPAVRK